MFARALAIVNEDVHHHKGLQEKVQTLAKDMVDAKIPEAKKERQGMPQGER